jgi:hypothetical protein
METPPDLLNASGHGLSQLVSSFSKNEAVTEVSDEKFALRFLGLLLREQQMAKGSINHHLVKFPFQS